MVSSDESVDEIKLSLDKGTEMGYLIGYSKVYKYDNIDGSLKKISLGQEGVKCTGIYIWRYIWTHHGLDEGTDLVYSDGSYEGSKVGNIDCSIGVISLEQECGISMRYSYRASECRISLILICF